MVISASGRAWINGGGVNQLALAKATERVLGQPRRAGGGGLGAASLLEILLLLGGAPTLPCFSFHLPWFSSLCCSNSAWVRQNLFCF